MRTGPRIDFEVFAENVKEIEPKMLAEIHGAMGDWLDIADTVGVRPQMDELFRKRTNDFIADLTMAGLKLLIDYAVPLRDADNAWRRANPERASDFPEEEPLPEIS